MNIDKTIGLKTGQMRTRVYILVIVSVIGLAFRNDKPAYRIFDRSGKEVRYSKMLKELKDADIIFFGELHDNPIAHWMQYELTWDLYMEKGINLSSE